MNKKVSTPAGLNRLPAAPPNRVGWPWTVETAAIPATAPGGTPWPRVTVVTPSLNQGGYIEETIRSVLLQGYPDLEYIVIDGGSRDGTVDILRTYEAWLSCWVSEPDKGQSDAINKGWKKGTGDIVAWINADDFYYPGAIRAVAEIFVESEDIVLVCGSGHTVDQNGKTILATVMPPELDPYALIKCCGGAPTQPSVFMRRCVLDAVGFLGANLHYVMDWEFWIRIGLHYGRQQLRRTQKVLSGYREWAGTKTGRGRAISCRERRLVLDKLFAGNKDDEILRRLKRSAFSSSYRIEAQGARDKVETAEALRNLFRAWSLAPLDYNPILELLFLLSVLMGGRRRAKLKQKVRALILKESAHGGKPL